MRRALVLVLLAAGCGDSPPIDGSDPLRVSAGVDEVALGASFPLTVVRVRKQDEQPVPWDDGRLAPLSVRLRGTVTREGGGLVEETRRYDAYAFTLEDQPAFGLEVRRALDSNAPGPAELPVQPESSFPWWALGLAAAAAAAAAVFRRRRRAPAVATPATEAPPPPPPHVVALERIARLRGLGPAGRAEVQAFYGEATGVLRTYLDAEMSTTDEIIARHHALAHALRHCDLVMFARHAPTAAERERMLDGVESFLRETAP